jgi:hypothetical protein
MHHRTLRRLPVVLVAAAAVAASTVSSAPGAVPVVNEHTGPVSDTFADELCGIAGTTASRFVGDFKLYADGTFLSTGNFSEVFTAAASGAQLVSRGVEQVTGPFDPTNNGDGTITQTFTFKGLPVKLSLLHGPTLLRDAGNATVAITFALNPDGTRGDFLSQVIAVEHGPHPSLDDGSLFCATVIAALT